MVILVQNRHSKLMPPLLIHALEHEYSSAELSMTSLKRADKGHVATLQSACEDRGFELLLCTVEKRVMGMADDDDDGYGYGHRRGYDSLGEESEEPPENFHGLFIDDDVFKGDPDEEDYEGHMGNAAASATHYYHKAAVLIVAQIFRNALMWHTMQNGELEILPSLAHLRDQVTNSPSDQNLRDQLLGLCRNIVASYGTEPKLRVADSHNMYSYIPWDKSKIAEPKLRDTFAQIGFSHRQWDMFKSAVKESTTDFGAKFGEAIYHYGLQDFRAVLEELWIMPPTIGFDPIQLLISITTTDSGLCTADSRPASEEFKEWEKSTFIMLLNRVLEQHDLDDTTGRSFVAALKIMKREDTLRSITPDVTLCASRNTGFAVGFLDSLYMCANEGIAFTIDEIRVIYQFTLDAALTRFQVQKLQEAQPQTQSSYGYYFRRPAAPTYAYINPHTVASIVRQTHEMGLDSSNILRAVLASLSTIQGEEAEKSFRMFSCPLAQSLCGYLQSRIGNRERFGPEIAFIVSVFEICLTKRVGPAPEPPRTWERVLSDSGWGSGRRCGCGDCASLERFIKDPEQSVWKLIAAEKRRNHVSNKLDSTFSTDTIRQGSPYTLEVRKTNRQWQADTKPWEKQCSMIIGGLERLKDCTPLLKVIGEDAYNSRPRHDSLRPSSGVPLNSTAAAPPAPGNVV
ncbi:hypothetical protein BJX68DRAFT_272188 [Aspergillus pseudodeflectus]|uniref:Uncharacterized protein n=1 Tax=Aspergillus pseudodeflectus TaxID=176178 RepID=A0ABR4JH56_9EURO